MDITLQRKPAQADGIFGQFLDSSSNPICMTLERAYQNALGQYAPIIPAGSWTCVRRLSPRLGYKVFMLTGVPNHNYLEIHIANWEIQLEGCIATGVFVQGDMLMESKVAFDKFMSLQEGVNQFTLKVIDG